MSSPLIGGSADAEDVTPVSVQDRSPPRRARSVMTGCEARGKAQGRLLRPGATGEGKTGRVNTSEPPRMPRYGNSPRRVVLAGMIRSEPLRIGRRRPRTVRRSCGHRCSRGTGGTRPGRISCVWNVETPSWSSRRQMCWSADREEGSTPRRDRMAQEANAGTPKGDGNLTAAAAEPLAAGRGRTGRISGPVPEPERAPTWAR